MSKPLPLFSENFPDASTNEELKAVLDSNPHLDSYYVATVCIPERRKMIEAMWELFEPYSDSNSPDKARKYGFHAFSWEVLIGWFLRTKGIDLKGHEDFWPDVITDKPHIYIECAIVEKWKEGLPDSVPKRRILVVSEIPVRQILIRISQAISNKVLQYNLWKDKDWFLPSVPYVLALNLGELEQPEWLYNMPFIVSTVFAIWDPSIHRITSEVTWWERRVVYKTNGSPVSVDFFLNPKYSFISWIIATSRHVIDWEVLSDMVYVANPLATNPIDTSTFSFMKCWIVDENGQLIPPSE